MSMPIIEGADGVTLTSTGLVAFREHADFVDNVFAGMASDRERAFRFVMTLNHEAIHFLQCFTASFPYRFSLSILDIASQLMAVSRDGLLTIEQIREFKRGFDALVANFRSPYDDISTIDLLEAMAVTEGYHATVTDRHHNASDFGQFLLEYFPVKDSEYRRVIDRITDVFGSEAGYHLTPRLCYISLNSDHPARAFSSIVEHLSSDRKATAFELTAAEILTLFGMDTSSSFLKMSESGLPDNATHPIFQPYMQLLSHIGSLEDRYEFCAQPGKWIRPGGPPQIGNIVPPLAVFSGGRGRVMGLAQNWSKEKIFLYLDSAAMIGACLVLLSGDKYHQTCRHDECPLHSSTLCHSWFAKPHAIPWTDCIFPERISVQFGTSVSQLLESFKI